jgi:Planctomycete cytochrome C
MVARGLFLAVMTAAWLASAGRAGDPAPRDLEFFEQKIRPVLVARCYRCHSADAKQVKGGLRLDSRAGMLRGGDTGPAVVPGKARDSLLLKAIRHQADVPRMPPTGARLPDNVLADFEKWIALGAPRPDEKAASVAPRATSTHWSFQPVRQPELPTVKNQVWVRNAIDAFVLAWLEAQPSRAVARSRPGNTPAPAVSRSHRLAPDTHGTGIVRPGSTPGCLQARRRSAAGIAALR